MRMAQILFLSLGITALANPAGAQHRELGAHEHGQGTLNIAVEGTRLSLELEAPGADIVGFEYAAKTRKDKAAVATAKKRLSAPLGLFRFPASAGCVLKSASVEVEADDQDRAKEAKAGKDQASKGAAGRKEQDHSQFHAQYELDCKSLATITAIEFDYFMAFAGAQKLDVNLITPKGQTKYQVTRANPRVDLAGMM